MSTKKSSTNKKPTKYLWGKVRVKFSQFCAHCTMHGVYYFSVDGRWWLRWVWLVIICCSLGLCCFLSHMIWDKFVVDPTLTVVETTHYSTADIPFPAVTVCDTELVYAPATENITNLLILRGYNRSQVTEFYASFARVQDKKYAPPAYVRKIHFLLDDLGYPLKTLLKMFKKPCEEILMECYWRSRPHNCTEMFRSVYTVVGYCCQFDVPFFKEHTTTETNFISGVQSTEALDFIVSGKKISTDGNDTETDGNVVLYVFDLKDRVTLMDSAIILTPAAFFDINVFLWAIDSSSYVKALNLQSRKCILDTDPRIGTSFYQECLTRLILKKVVKECKCLPFNFSAKELDVEDYSTCTWDRLICVYQNIEKTEADVRELISQNECYQRCDYVQYETEVEFVKNNRNLRYISNRLPKRMSFFVLLKIEDIHSRVVVHFSDTTCMKYRREVLYTWDQMLANLGGIFGLCLGGSIVSVMEIIWFLFDLLFTTIHETYTKKLEPKKNEKYKNKVFIINQSIPKPANKTLIADQKDLNARKLVKTSAEVRFKFIN